MIVFNNNINETIRKIFCIAGPTLLIMFGFFLRKKKLIEKEVEEIRSKWTIQLLSDEKSWKEIGRIYLLFASLIIEWYKIDTWNLELEILSLVHCFAHTFHFDLQTDNKKIPTVKCSNKLLLLSTIWSIGQNVMKISKQCDLTNLNLNNNSLNSRNVN